VPTPTVSIVELVAVTERDTTRDEIHEFVKAAAAGKMKGILGLTFDPVVSMDIKGDDRSSIIDGACTNVVGGNLVKVAAWYDKRMGLRASNQRPLRIRGGQRALEHLRNRGSRRRRR
jgi:glyceraldehyde 3-phosphate dehydrogenase